MIRHASFWHQSDQYKIMASKQLSIYIMLISIGKICLVIPAPPHFPDDSHQGLREWTHTPGQNPQSHSQSRDHVGNPMQRWSEVQGWVKDGEISRHQGHHVPARHPWLFRTWLPSPPRCSPLSNPIEHKASGPIGSIQWLAQGSFLFHLIIAHQEQIEQQEGASSQEEETAYYG